MNFSIAYSNRFEYIDFYYIKNVIYGICLQYMFMTYIFILLKTYA